MLLILAVWLSHAFFLDDLGRHEDSPLHTVGLVPLGRVPDQFLHKEKFQVVAVRSTNWKCSRSDLLWSRMHGA